jgi:hypothetical protein
LAVAVLAAALGGGVAFWAAGRTWATATVRRSPPLPPEVLTQSGRDLVPWAAAAALVAVAGGLALVATRGWGRAALSAVLALAGLAIGGGGVAGLAGSGARDGAALAAGWPVLCCLGGVLILAAGLLGLWRGGGWPAMGARYEPPTGTVRTPEPVTGAELWDSLDRGDDPTTRPAVVSPPAGERVSEASISADPAADR